MFCVRVRCSCLGFRPLRLYPRQHAAELGWRYPRHGLNIAHPTPNYESIDVSSTGMYVYTADNQETMPMAPCRWPTSDHRSSPAWVPIFGVQVRSQLATVYKYYYSLRFAKETGKDRKAPSSTSPGSRPSFLLPFKRLPRVAYIQPLTPVSLFFLLFLSPVYPLTLTAPSRFLPSEDTGRLA